jgi:hypothetical protein
MRDCDPRLCIQYRLASGTLPDLISHSSLSCSTRHMTSLSVSISNLVFDGGPPFLASLQQAGSDAQTHYLASLNDRLAQRYGQNKIPSSIGGTDGSVIDVREKRAYILRIARRMSTAYHLKMRIASTTGYSLDIVVNSREDDAPSILSISISPSQDDNNPSEAFALISQLARDVVAEYQACLNEGGLPTFASREEADPFFAQTETLEAFESTLGTWAGR